MSLYKKNIGKKGEDIAEKYLKSCGYQILEKNFYTRFGEIDLIAKENTEIVFVEVKTRKNKKHGEPQEAVNFFKQKNLIRTARQYLQKQKSEEQDWRIDVIAILLQKQDNQIEHIKNAVTYF